MTNEQIGKFIVKKKTEDAMVRISFRIRNSVTGVFIRSNDFEELGRKNMWRVVTESNADAYSKTRDMNLCRIYKGVDFKKLELV